jgi:hypothetical protein
MPARDYDPGEEKIKIFCANGRELRDNYFNIGGLAICLRDQANGREGSIRG